MTGTIPISGLPASAGAQLGDIMPIVQSGVTYKESLSQIMSLYELNMNLPQNQVTGLHTTDVANFAGAKLSGLTASRLVSTDSSKQLASVTTISSWVTGTASRITSTDNGVGGTQIDISASYVGQSSITTLGTISTGTWQGSVIGATYGGTGVNNGSNTITLAGSMTTSGAYPFTFTFTGATNVTFPTSGTLATTGGTVSTITGTANQVLVNGASGTPTSGAIILTLPQSIGTGNSPQFTGLNLLGLTASYAVVTDGSKNLASLQYTDSPVSSTIVYRNANGTTTANNFVSLTTSTAASGSPITLNPNATQIVIGSTYEFNNNATGDLTINDNSNTLVTTVKPGAYKLVTVKDISTPSGVWDVHSLLPGNYVASTTLFDTDGASIATSAQVKCATFQMTTSPVTGYVMTTDNLGNGSWAAVSSLGAITTINGNTGSVTPTSGVVTINGGTTGLTTSGSGSTLSLTGTLILANGGTNANLTASNGGIVYSTASAMAILAGTSTANKMLLSGASTTPTWSTSTIPSSAGATANKVLLSDGTNYVLSTPTFPNASATSGKIIISDGTNWIASTPTFPNSASSAGTILRADGTNWVATTATYPATTTINQILYSSAANTVSGITASNNGVLISGTTGIPSWLAAGTTGQVLIATTSNPPSWGAISGVAVTSLTGTANQVLVNGTSGVATRGDITLTLPQSIATTSNVQFATMGIGQVPISYAVVAVSGTVTAVSGGFNYGVALNTTHSPSSVTTNAVELMVNPTITSNSDITNVIGGYFKSGINGAGSGVLTNGYSIYAEAPINGNNKTAIYTDNLSVGYTGITPSTNSVCVAGSVFIGSSTGSGKFHVQGSVSGSGAIYGALMTTSVTETGSSAGTCALYIGGTHTVNGSGTNIVSYLQIAPVVTATTTVSTAYGILAGAGTGTGTITNAYSIYAINPGFGSNKAAIYTDNLSVGYTGVSPPNPGAIIQGKLGVGVSTVDIDSNVEISSSGTYGLRISGTQTTTAGNLQGSIWIRSALQPTSGASGIVAHIFNQAFVIAPSAQTIANAAACYLAQDYEFNVGTITNAFQLLIGTTAGLGGTITNSYGAYINTPSAGTNKCALYTDNLSIGYTGTAPNSLGASISGPVSIGTSSASSSAVLEITSTTKGVRLPRVSLPGTNVSSPVEALILYEATYKAPYFYDGSSWMGIGGLCLLSAGAYSSIAALGVTTTSNSPLTNFNSLLIVFENLLPVTDSVTFQFQVSTNNGTSYLSTGYAGGVTSNATASSATWSNVNSTSYVTCGALRNTSPAWGYIILGNRNFTAPTFNGMFSQLGSVGIVNAYQTTANINSFQISFSSGNISTVKLLVYGILQS